MRTLVLNGSPRKNGDTAALLQAFYQKLEGEVTEVRAFCDDIAPCIDCRWCWKNPGCAQKDGMQAVYDAVQAADNIVVASPVNFSELTGPLLGLAGRFQTYWTARNFRGEEPIPKRKNGAILLAGGGTGKAQRAIASARLILNELAADCVARAYALQTDERPPAQDEAARGQAERAALQLNKLYHRQKGDAPP